MEKQELINELKKAKTVKRPRGNPGGLSLYYKDVIAAFDIETTNDPEINNSYMYAWGFCINDKYISGRTWEEFIELTTAIKRECQGAAVPVYVHFLSFEFVFLSGILNFEPADVICGKAREIIKAYSYPFEFRCSYKLTGLSLDVLTRSMNVKHIKLSGEEYNYNLIRYPWTPLKKFEKDYLKHDVLGLMESIKKQMKIYNDSIYTIPITKTGYVRRQLKKRMRTYPWEYVEKQRINIDIYKMLNMAMRGGNVHANRYLAGEIIPGVDSWDISSAYPAAMVYGLFPMGQWKVEADPIIDDVIRLIYLRKRAALASLKFKNIRTKNKYEEWPYISESKSFISKDIPKEDRIIDNGRVLAIKGDLIGCYTDLDLKIIIDQYEWDDVEVLQLAHTKYRPLPNQIREYILELYEKKTKLKGTKEVELYTANKTEINGAFGSLAEDPGKIYMIYNNGKFEPEKISREDAAARKIQKSNLSYAWGVWVPAIVRFWTQGILKELGDDGVYTDTDGVKSLEGIIEPFKRFNAQIEDFAAQIPGTQVADNDGVIHTLGAWEYEGSYDRFITLGTKKYAYEQNGELNITTAGVNKKKGAKELGRLEKYKEDFTFYEAAGREAIYNDDADFWIEREGHKLHITRNVFLKNSSFTLGLTAEYRRLIQYPGIINKIFEEMGLK